MSKYINKTITVQMKNHETLLLSGTWSLIASLLKTIEDEVQAVMFHDIAGSGFWNVDHFIEWVEDNEMPL